MSADFVNLSHKYVCLRFCSILLDRYDNTILELPGCPASAAAITLTISLLLADFHINTLSIASVLPNTLVAILSMNISSSVLVSPYVHISCFPSQLYFLA
jgi:hypothetical protein